MYIQSLNIALPQTIEYKIGDEEVQTIEPGGIMNGHTAKLTIDPPAVVPLADHTLIVGRGPFTRDDELRLLVELRFQLEFELGIQFKPWQLCQPRLARRSVSPAPLARQLCVSRQQLVVWKQRVPWQLRVARQQQLARDPSGRPR